MLGLGLGLKAYLACCAAPSSARALGSETGLVRGRVRVRGSKTGLQKRRSGVGLGLGAGLGLGLG